MWWGKDMRKPDRSSQDWGPAELPPAPPVRGFAEAVARTAAKITGNAGAIVPPPAQPPKAVPKHAVFPSEGPHGHRERMRDRLLDRGPDGIADYELLEMLLFFAQPKGDTKPVAKRLINQFGSYGNALAAPARALEAVEGVGRHSVAALKLVHAAAVRLARSEVMDRPVMCNWDALMDYLNAALARERIEQFRVLFLDSKNRLIADEAQARGTVNHTPVYPREIVKRALELHAASLILTHNHPSGDPTPSCDDIIMTQQIVEAAKALSIAVHDHVIVGNGTWLSFRREGYL
jgi:DNA repair protein RadC